MKTKIENVGFTLVLALAIAACSKSTPQKAEPVVTAYTTQVSELKASIAPTKDSGDLDINTVFSKGKTSEKFALGLPNTKKPAVAPKQANTANSIKAQITVKKAAIFNQDYFYGADLQYSSIYDKDLDLYNQSTAMGHIPVFFRRNGDELQLVADNRRLFPSDINHPERLISR